MDEKKMWSIHTMEYSTVMKINKVQLQAMWMNLTKIELRGKKDMKEHIHYDSICIKLLISKTKLYCVEKHKS